MRSERLSSYPYVVVRVACRYCDRKGSYRLARLAAKFGPDVGMDELLEALAFNCGWRRQPGQRQPGKYDPKCGAHFPDLDPPRPGPDLPPGGAVRPLRLVRGGGE